ncbi:MAG: cytochrome c [Thermodesulfobacteriota bacterium]
MKQRLKMLRTIIRTTFVIGLIVGFAGTSLAAGDVKRGKRKYNEFCTPCHGSDGQGDGTRMKVEKFDPAPRNHTDGKYMNKRTDVQLFKVVKEGGKANNFSHIMPQWNHILKDKQIWNIVAYIRSLAVNPAWSGKPDPPDPADGKK